MNAQVGAKHHVTLHSALGTTSAIEGQKKNEGNNEYDQSLLYNFLVKQQKGQAYCHMQGQNAALFGGKMSLAVLIIKYKGTIQSGSQPAQLNLVLVPR